MAIKIKYDGKLAKLTGAVSQANDILSSSQLLEIIKSRQIPFSESNPSNLAPSEIASRFGTTGLNLTLNEYQAHDSIGGKFMPAYPVLIWANTNAVKIRTQCAIAGMLIHECVHALSYHLPDINFSHDGDSPQDNQDTAPYWIQRNVRLTFCGVALKSEPEYIIVQLDDTK